MRPRFDYGDAVRVIRHLRNDGTFPGSTRGALLVRRGSLGHVTNVGTFLQDQLIYSVHFLDQDRLVGCREEELIGAREPWMPSRFETREKVRAGPALTVGGQVLVKPGTLGEVMEVLRQDPNGPCYRVYFPGHLLQVPEAVLLPLDDS